MAQRKYPSGYAKRLMKQKRDEEEAKGKRTIDSFIGWSKFQRNDPVQDDLETHDSAETAAASHHTPDLAVSSDPETCESSHDDSIPGYLSDDQEHLELEVQVEENYEASEGVKNGFDLGILSEFDTISSSDVDKAVKCGPPRHPLSFPKDDNATKFPRYVLTYKTQNGEMKPRDWLVWSKEKEGLFCFPCRLLGSCQSKSILSSKSGWSKSKGWKKLYNRIPEHQASAAHSACYVKWRLLQFNHSQAAGVDDQLQSNILSNIATWTAILERILHVVMFLAQRALPFRGDSDLVGHSNNGNFLGIIELLAIYDPILSDHVSKVQTSQESKKRLQVHYLSPSSQNEFIAACSSQVLKKILQQVHKMKYYSIQVDATPDSSHMEQTTFILRYVLETTTQQQRVVYEVIERFVTFISLSKKTGSDITSLILDQLKVNATCNN